MASGYTNVRHAEEGMDRLKKLIRRKDSRPYTAYIILVKH